MDISSSVGMLPNKTAIGRQNAFTVVNDVHLLHSILGHLSLSKMQHICDFNCQGLHEYNCGVSLHFKQHKLSFPISNSSADHYFDLLHIDLWGPYIIHALNRAIHNSCFKWSQVFSNSSR